MATHSRMAVDESTTKGAPAGGSGIAARQTISGYGRRADRRRGYMTGHQPRYDGQDLTTFLGWLSVGLGLAQIAAPRIVVKMIGLSGDGRAMPFFGVREIATGLGILTQRRPVPWLWGRVAGDVMDLAMLGAAFREHDTQRGRLAGATAAVLSVTLLDLMAARQLSRKSGAKQLAGAGTVRARKTITIGCSPDQLYRFWRNFENLPRVMSHLDAVRPIDETHSHWIARGLGGKRFEWESEITDDRPNEMIAWRSLEGADVSNSGVIRFERAPADRGAVVRVEIEYRPPGGAIGATVAKLFGQAPEQQIQEDLRRLKQLMELGETPTTEGQPSGRKRGMIGRLSLARILEGQMR